MNTRAELETAMEEYRNGPSSRAEAAGTDRRLPRNQPRKRTRKRRSKGASSRVSNSVSFSFSGLRVGEFRDSG
jgi:hypothetical protein